MTRDVEDGQLSFSVDIVLIILDPIEHIARVAERRTLVNWCRTRHWHFALTQTRTITDRDVTFYGDFR